MATDTAPLIAITGSNEPYVYDLPHVLSLPSGAEFRFRYREEWVSKDLLQEIREKPTSFAEAPLLLIYHSLETKRLLLLRQCSVVSLEALGGVVVIRFRVGKFASRPTGSGAQPLNADQARGALSARAAQLLRDALKPDQDLSKSLGDERYLRRAGSADRPEWWSSTEGAKAADAWWDLVKLLDDEPKLFDIPMFYLLGFQRETGTYLPLESLVERPNFVEGIRGARLKAPRLVEGERYRFRALAWRTEKKKIPVNVTCKFDEGLLSLEGSSSLVVGKYDALEFTLVAKTPGLGQIELRADPDQPASPAPPWPRLYAARVPISVRHDYRRIAIMVVVFLVGVGVHIAAKKIDAVVGFPAEISMLAGTVLVFAALGDFAARFVKFGNDFRDFSRGGRPRDDK